MATDDAAESIKRSYLDGAGNHPFTGEPFVRVVELSFEQDCQPIHLAPPTPPSRRLYEYPDDSDEPVYVRDRTDSEMEEAQAEFAAESKRYRETNGVEMLAGRQRVIGHFKTESGAESRGRMGRVQVALDAGSVERVTAAKRNRLVQTRLNDDTFDKLNAKADPEGMSVASYVRRMILLDVFDRLRQDGQVVGKRTTRSKR